MSIVSKLKEDAEQAEKLLKESLGIKVEGETLEDPPSSEVPNKEEEPKTPETPEPEVPAPQSVSELETKIQQLQKQLDDENTPTWKNKYLTLQGMFNKLNEDFKGLKKDFEEAKANPPAPEPAKEEPISSETLDKLRQDYGESVVNDLVRVITKTVKESIGGDLKETKDTIAEIKSAQGTSAKETFFLNLTHAVPDWKSINGWESEGMKQDPKWTAFLLQEIPGTKRTYDQELNSSYAAMDADAVARLFNLFKSQNKPVEETPETPEPPKPAKPDVNNFIDPGAGGGASVLPAENNNKKFYSAKEIDNFYASVTKGTFRGTREERDKLDNLYQAAIIEGRVK